MKIEEIFFFFFFFFLAISVLLFCSGIWFSLGKLRQMARPRASPAALHLSLGRELLLKPLDLSLSLSLSLSLTNKSHKKEKK